MKDHEKRELVNRLTDIARKFGATEQLRERIACEVLPALVVAVTAERERWISEVLVIRGRLLQLDPSADTRNVDALLSWTNAMVSGAEGVRST